MLVQDSVVSGATGSGILLRQVTNATVRNNLVYDNAEWGISLDNSTGASIATGQLVERNSSAFNGTGDLRLANARGVVHRGRARADAGRRSRDAAPGTDAGPGGDSDGVGADAGAA